MHWGIGWDDTTGRAYISSTHMLGRVRRVERLVAFDGQSGSCQQGFLGRVRRCSPVSAKVVPKRLGNSRPRSGPQTES